MKTRLPSLLTLWAMLAALAVYPSVAAPWADLGPVGAPCAPSTEAAGAQQAVPDAWGAQLLSGWSEDALFDQPRLTADAALAAAYGFQPGTTDWRPSRGVLWGEPPAAWFIPYPDPRHALAAFVAHHTAQALGDEVWEVTARLVVDRARAVGAVLTWGYRDDALAGVDYRLTLQRDADGWRIAGIEERYHCRRGVAGGLCL